MKISISLVVMLVSAQGLFAQAKLSTLNPIPRLGDSIEISLDINDSISGFSGSLKVNKLPEQTGPYSVGPVKLSINDQAFETDILTVDVQPALPKGVKDGIWMRLAEINGSYYLIVEERKSGE